MNQREPIAIIGMACRFAGGNDTPEQFWSFLREGRDAIGELPADRWAGYAAPGPEYADAVRDVTRRGAFLADVKGFDAEFFDITPREAALMDPQQRIVVELAWEALEHAGIPPHSLSGTDAGVFMGVGSDDYGRRLLEDLPHIEAWTGIGGAYCAVANRVSHLLNLRGPSLAVDTACSSSLVSIHLAAQALRDGECPVALAGGVLVMAAPGLSLVLDAAGATAPDGRCKSFDAAADGYGRGEGGGVIVLKRLSQARRDGDRVLALIRASAVHQDGRTPGIMAPNGPAQAHLMRRAYRSAGLDPATVGYVEAHGTGTRVGDPLEAGAMAAVFGAGRPAGQPCLIGSVKTNIGHLEAGAGVAGVIKTVLALRHAEIPPSLNLTTPNPAIPWDTAGLRVVTEPTPWPVTGGPRRAGVSGYGYGGTIAHVILEQGDPPPAPSTSDTRTRVFPLSASSPAALGQYADRLADRLADGPPLSLADVSHTLSRGRSHLAHRATVLAADRDQLIDRLRELAGSPTATAPVLGGPGLVWVFSGHGSQWTGMARESLAGDAAFAEVIDALEPVFRAELGLSPRAAILDDRPQPVDVIQPMIFAVQLALAASWRAAGVRPDAVIGHSVGEIAAAVTAGMLTLGQGARLVCRRSALLRRVAGRGAMAMVNLPAAEAAARLGDRGELSVAVAASPGSAVISGDREAVGEVSRRWLAEGLDVRAVDSDVAFHSAHMDPLLADLTAAAAELTPGPARLTTYTTALPDPRDDAPRDGTYWATNLRGQVRFGPAITAAVEDGYRLFLEVSAHPVVTHSVHETFDALGVADAFVAHTLRRGRPERQELLTNLGLLHCHGADVDLGAQCAGGRLVDLPTIAWRRRAHWAPQAAARGGARHDPASHTLLGGRRMVHATAPAQVWQTRLDRRSRPYPGDHPVRDVEIVPAAVLLNTFLVAASSTGRWSDLADVALRVPVSVTAAREVQVVLQNGTIRLSSRIIDSPDPDPDSGPGHRERGGNNRDGGDDVGWVTHTSGVMETASPPAGGRAAVAAGERLPATYVVDRLAALGVAGMGFGWQLSDIERGPGALAATVSPGMVSPGTANSATASSATAGSATARAGVPPPDWACMLDAVLSLASVAFPGPAMLRMPAHIHRISLAETPPDRARITVRVIGEHTVDVDIASLDAGGTVGTVAGTVSRLRYGVLGSDVGAITPARRLLHEIVWRPAGRQAPDGTAAVVLVGPDGPQSLRVTGALVRAGIPHRVVAGPDELSDEDLAGDRAVVVVPAAGGDDESVSRAAWLLAGTAQRLAGAGVRGPARLWCVTQGVWEGTDPRALGHGPLWGLGRVIGGEYPHLWGGTIDIGQSDDDLAGLVEVMRTVRGEDVVVLRGAAASVARLRPLRRDPVRPPLTCRPEATYLITGGLGVLGLASAHHLVDRGARRIVLAARRAMPPRDTWDELTDRVQRSTVDKIRGLERLGVTVVTVAVDIADGPAAAAALSPAALGLPPIRGVVHAAGVLDNRLLRTLDEQSLRTVLRPKVAGSLVLHALFPPGAVDFFVLYSSCGQLLGLPGQASYAAGNAFLDALAAHRRAIGDTAAASYGWTSWRGLGMSTSSAVIDAELAARGTADISLTEALQAWDLAERCDLGYAAVLRTIPLEPGQQRSPLLSELSAESRPDLLDRSPADPGDPGAGESPPWLGLDPPSLRVFLTEEICRQVATETMLPPAEVDPRRPLIEMGVDSVMTVRIRRGLERRFRLALPPTLFWDRPTVDAVASLLAERVGEAA